MSVTSHISATALGAVVVVTLAASPAFAHSEFRPDSASAGTTAAVNLFVENEQSDAGTVKVELHFPRISRSPSLCYRRRRDGPRACKAEASAGRSPMSFGRAPQPNPRMCWFRSRSARYRAAPLAFSSKWCRPIPTAKSTVDRRVAGWSTGTGDARSRPRGDRECSYDRGCTDGGIDGSGNFPSDDRFRTRNDR